MMKERNDRTVGILFALFMSPFAFLLLIAVISTIDMYTLFSNIWALLVDFTNYFMEVLKTNSIYYTHPLFTT